MYKVHMCIRYVSYHRCIDATIPPRLFTAPVCSGWSRVGGNYTQTYLLPARSVKIFEGLWHTLYFI